MMFLDSMFFFSSFATQEDCVLQALIIPWSNKTRISQYMTENFCKSYVWDGILWLEKSSAVEKSKSIERLSVSQFFIRVHLTKIWGTACSDKLISWIGRIFLLQLVPSYQHTDREKADKFAGAIPTAKTLSTCILRLCWSIVVIGLVIGLCFMFLLLWLGS